MMLGSRPPLALALALASVPEEEKNDVKLVKKCYCGTLIPLKRYQCASCSRPKLGDDEKTPAVGIRFIFKPEQQR